MLSFSTFYSCDLGAVSLSPENIACNIHVIEIGFRFDCSGPWQPLLLTCPYGFLTFLASASVVVVMPNVSSRFTFGAFWVDTSSYNHKPQFASDKSCGNRDLMVECPLSMRKPSPFLSPRQPLLQRSPSLMQKSSTAAGRSSTLLSE